MMKAMTQVFKICFLAIAMWFYASGAMAKDLVVNRVIFEDATGAMTLAQVKGEAFQPAPEVIFEGFSRSTFWIRLTVQVPVDADALDILIRPTLLDSASLYYPSTAMGEPEIMLNIDSRSAQKKTKIELQPGLNTLYLRAESIGALLIHAQVMTEVAAHEKALNEYLELGAVLAIYALLTFSMVGLVWIRKDSLGGFFFVHLLVCLLLYILVFGFFENVVDSDWAHGKTATRFSAIANFLSFCLLMQSIQSHFGMSRLRRWTCYAAGGFLLLLVLFFVADRHLVLKFSAVFGPFTTLALLSTLFIIYLDFFKNKSITLAVRVIVGLMVTLFFVIVCRAMLQILGVLQGDAFLLQSPAWRGIFIPMGLIGFLWQRDREQSHALVQRQIDAAVSETRVKEQNLRLSTQSQFMGMLMHELKTPLYIIQVATTSLSRHVVAGHLDTKRLDNIARAADDMNFIIDRCVQAEQLDQSDLPVNKTPVALNTLLSEVMHIKGHERITLAGIQHAKVLADFQYARIILINLVTNALKYSPAGSLVVLRVQETQTPMGPGLTIRVSNSVGSAGPPDPAMVFTRYYRAEGAKKEVGAGLGLWLASVIATKLGSELRYSCDDAFVHFDFSLELS